VKKIFPLVLIFLGLVFAGAGAYTGFRGVDAKQQVRDELVAQSIVTPEDAAIPNVPVNDVPTAKAMADIIEKHSLESTGGLTYAELGRFITPDGDPAGTSNPDEAVIGADGKPVANPLRSTALTAANLRTSLYTSVMAFEVANLVIGLGMLIGVLGLAIGGLGVALAGLTIPAVARRFHVNPAAATATA